MHIQIILVIIITVIECRPELQEFFECEQKIDEQCFSNKNNFIMEKISQIPIKDKLEKINSLVPLYTKKKLQIINTETRGLTVFLNQTIYGNSRLFSYKLKNIIGSQMINKSMFLQNNHSMKHKNIKINRKLLIMYGGDAKMIKDILITINFFYHFCRLKDSLLMEDLLGVTLTPFIPIYKITKYEWDLFKYNLQEIKPKLQYKIESDKELYFKVFQVLQYILPDDKFTWYFQNDYFKFEDYLFIDNIRKSRQHGNKNKQNYMFPIMHYINQQNDILDDSYNYGFESFRKKSNIYIGTQKQLQGDELTTNYHYPNLYQYAFYSGFVPNAYYLDCYKIQILNKEQAIKYELESNSCLNSQTFPFYNFALMSEHDPVNTANCLNEKIQVLGNDINYIEFFQNIQSECYMHQKPPQVWIHILKIIENFKYNLSIHIEELQNYMELRKSHHKDTQIAVLLLQYQNYFLKKVSETNQFLLNKLHNK